MAQRSSSSSPSREKLHYFTLPDNGLNWGIQRQLRCMKINPNFDHYRSSSAPVRKELTQYVKDSGHRIDKPVPENSMVDLESAADRMRISMVNDKGKEKVQEDSNINNVGSRSWNLRTRRAACKAPQANGGGAMMTDVPAVSIVTSTGGGNCDVFSPVRRVDSRLRGGGGMGSGVELKVERPKFSFALTKEEIEDDFFAMTGAKPPRRPKRRPKAIQRKLNDLVPGFWLREVTPETYKVDDNPEPKKGLK